ncbi:hypothetical protein HYQ46_004266 [Verticillium longisporum]|nr:hypothetical protein HYQ46_004266 [Verticillium longisporum]
MGRGGDSAAGPKRVLAPRHNVDGVLRKRHCGQRLGAEWIGSRASMAWTGTLQLYHERLNKRIDCPKRKAIHMSNPSLHRPPSLSVPQYRPFAG